MKRRGMWAVTAGTAAEMGPVVSVHLTRASAEKRVSVERFTKDAVRFVEPAQVVALVQAGASYTEAVQRMAGKPIAMSDVEVAS
jgi:hypothetical protein